MQGSVVHNCPQAAGWYGPSRPTADDLKLQTLIDQLYRSGATIGNGGTADAIRDGVGHIQKGGDRINELQRWLRNNPDASSDDIHTAESLLQDLISAMSGEGFPG